MSHVWRNFLALFGSQVATWVLSLLTIAILPDKLGDNQFGAFAFASSFIGIFSIFAAWGIAPYLTREIARDVSRTSAYVVNALLLKVPLLIVLAVSAVLLIRLFGQPTTMQQLVAIYSGGMVLVTINTVLAAALRGEQRMTRMAFWATAGQYVTTGATLVAVLAGRGVLVLAGIAVICGVIPLAANLALLAPRLRGSWRIDLALMRTFLIAGLPFMVWDLVFTIYGSIDVTMLSVMAGNAVVAWYTVAIRLVGIPIFIPSLVVTALFPALARGGLTLSTDFLRMTNVVLRWMFLLMAPVAMGIALVADDIIVLLRYAPAFQHSAPLIRILALHIPVVGITMLLGMVLTAVDRQMRWVVVAAIAAVFNPALNLAAIPLTSAAFGDGAIGASIVTVLTEGIMLGGALILRPAGVLDRATGWHMARCALACAGMAGCVLAISMAALPLRITVGAVSYVALSLLFRTVSIRDLVRTKDYALALAPARLRSATTVTPT